MMMKRMNRRARAVLFGFAMAGAGVASVSAQNNLGEVQIYVFSQMGLPVDDASVQVNGDTYISDLNGLINFRHPPGTHQFTVLRDGQPVGIVEVPVRPQQATEVIITASAEPIVQREDEATRQEIESEQRATLETGGPTGVLRGTVVDIEEGEPVVRATIIFRGVDFETSTGDDGAFEAEVPRGEYSFSVIHPDFSTRTQDGVVVAAGETTEVEIELTPTAIRLDEVAVFASEEVIVQGGIANLIEETRNSSAVLSLIGAEQIGRTGDSDAAGALQRVTGITVVDGRFVFVRGMGERYSSSLLNGARLPSPEPDRRVVPLDLFPASVIESIAVQKTYSPDLVGDFGGGAISIRSAGIPDDRYQRRLRISVSGSVSYNDSVTFTDRLVGTRQPLDFLGVDFGERAVPEELDQVPFVAEETLFNPTGLTASDVTELGRSVSNDWEPEEVSVPPSFGLGASVRDKIDFANGSSLGFNIATLYSNSWSYSPGVTGTYEIGPDDEPVPLDFYASETSANEVDLGALMDVVYSPTRGTELESVTLLVRTTENSVESVEGLYQTDLDFDIRQRTTTWAELMLLSQGLGATHGLEILNQATANARYTFSLAQRYEPDQKINFLVEDVGGGDPNGTFDEDSSSVSGRRADDQQRIWTTVTDIVHDAEFSLEIPVFLFGRPAPDFLDLGVYGFVQQRETDIRRFGFDPTGNPETDSYYWQDLNDVFEPDNIGAEIEFVENTNITDNYSAQHWIAAGYASGDVLLPADIRMDLGLRTEYSFQSIETGDPNTSTLVSSDLAVLDVLPSITFTVPALERSQVRFGGSRTVNRPDLRELSFAPFFGPPGFGELRGNPDLQRAVIYNADVRWETYIALEESVSIGAFFKYFEDPIELVQVWGAQNARFPVNVPAATNLGVEVDWAFQLRFVSDLMRPLIRSVRSPRARRTIGQVAGIFRDLRTTGNVAWIQSQIDLGASGTIQTPDGASVSNTSESRPLQGQAPYVINAAIGYRNAVSFSQDTPIHSSLFLNYNVVGPYITSIGTAGVPDQYLQPANRLDLVFRQEIGYIFSLGLEIGNILDPKRQITIGDDPDGEVVQESQSGRSFSLSVSFDF